jgi:hypothetical protein
MMLGLLEISTVLHIIAAKRAAKVTISDEKIQTAVVPIESSGDRQTMQRSSGA